MSQRILVVDNIPNQGEAFRAILEGTGLEADLVYKTSEVSERVCTNQYALIAVDVSLTETPCAEFCRALKSGEKPVDCPVIVFATPAEIRHVLRCLEAGADGYAFRNSDAASTIERLQNAIVRGKQPAATRRTFTFQGEQFELAASEDQLFDLLQTAFSDLSLFGTRDAQLSQQLDDQLSQRKRIEKELRDSEALYHSLVENVPINLFRKDRDGRFTFANLPFCAEMGLSRDEVLGKTDYDFYPKALADKYRANDLQVIETGRVFEDTEAHQTPDGSKLWVHVLKTPVIDSEGEVTGIQCVFWDVTDRKRAEEELGASEARKQAIFEASLDCMLITDENGRIIEFNRAAERTFGYRRSEVLGQVMDELLIAPEMRERSRDNIEQYGATREEGSLLGKRVEVPLIRKNGEQFVAEMAMQPIPLGDTIHFATVLHDITNRKQWEQEIQEAKEAAESANRAKSDFLANMSHEIRTPMNAIIGMTGLVLDTELAKNQRDHLKIVQDSADSLLDLINDILDFSKIEAGKLELDVAPFRIHERLGDTMKSLAVRAHEKDLELACRIAPEVPEVVIGDAGRLRQIVVNLVSNAIKFTEQGEVVLDVGVNVRKDGEVLLHFACKDTGIGIPKLKQKAIFRAFEQADSSTTRRYGGTGLGLAIASRLVKLMHGGIWVESEVGKGSTFHFTTRLGEGSSATLSAINPEPGSVLGLSVLVVDDSDTNRKILVEMLGSWGMKPVAAANARDALELITAANDAGEPFAIVISDVNMPEMDGFELTEHIKKIGGLSRLPIILLTSSDRPGDIKRYRELEIDHYLTKPVKQSELLQTIEESIGVTAVHPEYDDDLIDAQRPEMAPLKILLAEDSITNQKLATALLAREGHAITVANNGREAVELATDESRSFDLILMDVQMPEMDGFEATKKIRRHQKKTGIRVPIMAMTAHAMKGDRERCLEEGMDGYIAKPIRTSELFDALATLHDSSVSMNASPPVQKPAPANNQQAGKSTRKLLDDNGRGRAAGRSGVINWSAALKNVNDHADLLQSVVEAVFEEVPDLMRQLEEAIHENNVQVVQRTAHTIKGTMRAFEADVVSNIAFELEEMGRGGVLENAETTFQRLQSQLNIAMAELHAFDSSESIFDE